MAQPKNEWTPDMIRRFTELHTDPEGFSFNQLSAMMSAYCGTEVSRNACIGKARRLGLPERSGKVRLPPKREVKVKMIKIRVDAPIAYEEAVTPSPSAVGVTINQLGSGVCKWPLGEMEDRPPYHYCGGKAEIGDPYCAEHAAKSRGAWDKRVTAKVNYRI
jgi:hypothetical protein